MQPREYTLAEVREQFLAQIHQYAFDTSRSGGTPQELCDRMAFGILVLLDGHGSMPGFKLAPSVHPDDKEYRRKNGENWYPTEEVACDVREGTLLHDQYYTG